MGSSREVVRYMDLVRSNEAGDPLAGVALAYQDTLEDELLTELQAAAKDGPIFGVLGWLLLSEKDTRHHETFFLDPKTCDLFFASRF